MDITTIEEIPDRRICDVRRTPGAVRTFLPDVLTPEGDAFLKDHGFEIYLGQYELELPVGSSPPGLTSDFRRRQPLHPHRHEDLPAMMCFVLDDVVEHPSQGELRTVLAVPESTATDDQVVD